LSAVAESVCLDDDDYDESDDDAADTVALMTPRDGDFQHFLNFSISHVTVNPRCQTSNWIPLLLSFAAVPS